MNRSERRRWARRHDERRTRVEVGRVKLPAGGEHREAQLRVFARGDNLLAMIEGPGGNPAGFVFAPWPWPQVDRTKAPSFGGKGFTTEAVATVEHALTTTAVRCGEVPYQQAYRWTCSSNPDDFAGDVFGQSFNRRLMCDALAALVAAGARQDRDLRVELVALPTGPAVRLTQWMAAAVLLACPGVPTEGEPLVLEVS